MVNIKGMGNVVEGNKSKHNPDFIFSRKLAKEERLMKNEDIKCN